MYTPEELLKMIENGTSAETLAQTFTDALNGALDLQNKKKEEAEAAKKKEEETKRRETEEIAALVSIIDNVITYTNKFYPSLESLIKAEFTEEMKKETAKELIAQFKILNKTAKTLSDEKPSADPFADFFKLHSLL